MCSILHTYWLKHLKARSTEGLSPHPVMQRRFHHLYIIYLHHRISCNINISYIFSCSRNCGHINKNEHIDKKAEPVPCNIPMISSTVSAWKFWGPRCDTHIPSSCRSNANEKHWRNHHSHPWGWANEVTSELLKGDQWKTVDPETQPKKKTPKEIYF